MLPPESERAGASGPPPRTSKASITRAAWRRAATRRTTDQREKARVRRRSETAFSHTGRSPMTPTA